MTTDYPGIDYGMGQSNCDPKTGIRYGVINANSCADWFWDQVQAEYDAHCPHCGEPLDDHPGWDDESVCPLCEEFIDDGDQYGDEPSRQCLDDTEYTGDVSEMGELFLTNSPYYTNAQFCSPCVPGAGNLDSPCCDGPKTYCLGHDWFQSEQAPYPVYCVKTGELVQPENG